MATEWGCETDYTTWSGVVTDQGWGHSGDLDAMAYRQAVREIPWTIPPVPEFPRESITHKQKFSLAGSPGSQISSEGVAGDTKDWAFLLARYSRLSPAQRSTIRQLIESWLPD